MAKTENIQAFAPADPSAVAETNKEYMGHKGRLLYVPLESLFARPERNVRMRAGTEVEGVKMVDGYELPGMIEDIKKAGMIREPLLVSKKKRDGNDVYEVLRGYRRYLAACDIVKDGSDGNTIASFKKIPVLAYEGLTERQEENLINDQTSKRFSRTEVALQVWKMLRNGHKWWDIGIQMNEQLANFTGSWKNATAVKNAKDNTEKVKAIRSWLGSTLYNYIQGIYDYGGPLARKWFIQTMQIEDGIFDETLNEKPPFELSQKRWQTLSKALKEDQKAGYHPERKDGEYGPAWNAAVDVLTREASKPRGRKASGSKARDGTEIKKQIEDDKRSELVRNVLTWAMAGGEQIVNLEGIDAIENNRQKKKEIYDDKRGLLPTELRRFLDMAFSTDASPDDFDRALSEYVPDAPEKEENQPAETEASELTV